MESLSIIIKTAISIMAIEINVCGYDVSLMGLLCYGGAIFLLFWFIFGLFK